MKPPGGLVLKVVATRQDGRLVAWDEHGDVWILERHTDPETVPRKGSVAWLLAELREIPGDLDVVDHLGAFFSGCSVRDGRSGPVVHLL